MPDVMKTVGRYEILREVGRGGMAMVYLARQTDLDRFVALKELGAFHASDPSFAQRFLRESRVAGSLSHPNICTVHDYFEHDGTPYIAMEYIERGSLRPYVGSMNLAQIGGVLEGLLAGLAHGEQHGIVHRDLKPENLMVTSDGRVKIADFGIAKATNNMQTGAFLTATGTTVGTPTYMAPEQAMAQDIGPWTDLYSVGCMAFEMFTGRVPFHDTEAPMAILLRHVNEQIPSVKSIDPTIDQDISDWIEPLLVKDPKQRTQSANDAWDEFEEIIIGLLGPRWRREARLREGSAQFDTPKPLTPAPFQGTTADAAVSDEFQSFAWGNAGHARRASRPGRRRRPRSRCRCRPIPVVGPPTPEPGPRGRVRRHRAAGPDRLRLRDLRRARRRARGPGGRGRRPARRRGRRARPRRSSRRRSSRATRSPSAAPSAAPEPSRRGRGGFETYIAPAPLRPPTDDAPPEAPALPVPEPPAAAPEPEPAPDRREPAAAAPPPPRRRRSRTTSPRRSCRPRSPPPPPVEDKPTARRASTPAQARAGRGGRRRSRRAQVRQRRADRLRHRGVLAAFIGTVIGGSGGSDKPAGGGKPTATTSNADLSAKFPSDWKKASAATIPGITFSSPISSAVGRRERRRRPGQAGRGQLDAAAGGLPAGPRARRG